MKDLLTGAFCAAMCAIGFAGIVLASVDIPLMN